MSNNDLEKRIASAVNNRKKISQNDLDRLKEGIDIVDVIGSYLEIERKGPTYIGICPFHSEKTPSFKVNQDRGFFHCFGCKESGDAISFVMKYNSLNYLQAIKYLAQNHLEKNNSNTQNNNSNNNQTTTNKDSKDNQSLKISLEFNLESPLIPIYQNLLTQTQNFFLEQLKTNQSSKANQARKYLGKKRIGEDIIEKVAIGFAPDNQTIINSLLKVLKYNQSMDDFESMETLYKCGLMDLSGHSFYRGRITFPISTHKGQVVGFNARVTNGTKENKYKNSPSNEIFSKSHMFYGLENLDIENVRKYGLAIVEGITDTLGFVKQDLNNALVLGSASITQEQMGIIQAINPKHIYLMPDGDGAGVRGAISAANKLIGSNMQLNNSYISSDDVSIVPINNRKKDPFDIFFEEEQDILKYFSENQMSTKEFLLSRNKKELLFFGPNNSKMESFLLNNTYNILPLSKLHDIEIYMTGTQVRSVLAIAKTHPFIFQ